MEVAGLRVVEVGICVDDEGTEVITGGTLGDEATGRAVDESREGKSVDPGNNVGRPGCTVGILRDVGASVAPSPIWGAAVGPL